MGIVNAKCLLCGKVYLLDKDHRDYKKLVGKVSSTFVCDKCNHKVRYETEEQSKPIKPM